MATLVNCNFGGEEARLAALLQYDVLDTDPEEAFDKITRLAKIALQMPMVAVSLVDRDRQWFKSRQGIASIQTPRSISFCTHTIQGVRPLIVADARSDVRFASSPLVVGEPFIRCYIGVPLRSHEGQNVGALCAMDTVVREPSPEQVQLLEHLACLVVDELELRVRASTDSLTGVMRRRPFDEQVVREIVRARRHKKPLSYAFIDVDHFKSINDAYGHGVGDLVLKKLAEVCTTELRGCDYFGRIGGEEFAVLLPETDLVTGSEVAERLRGAIEKSVIQVSGATINITASIGVTEYDGSTDDFETLLKRADSAMYDAKGSGRNRVVCRPPAGNSDSERAARSSSGGRPGRSP